MLILSILCFYLGVNFQILYFKKYYFNNEVLRKAFVYERLYNSIFDELVEVELALSLKDGLYLINRTDLVRKLSEEDLVENQDKILKQIKKLKIQGINNINRKSKLIKEHYIQFSEN